MGLTPKITAQATAISPVDQPDERATVSQDDLLDSLHRLDDVGPIRQLPTPHGQQFWMSVAVRIAHDAQSAEVLTPRGLIEVMARRETREWLTLHPRWAWLHRRFNTRRWRFARDGSLT